MDAGQPIARLALMLGVLAGCAGTTPAPGGAGTSRAIADGRDMNAAMASWKGRRADEAVAMWGMPDSITRDGALGQLRWKADAMAIGDRPWGVPFAGDEAASAQRREDWPLRCARSLSVDIQEVVQHASWSRGEGCSTDPADYLPPP